LPYPYIYMNIHVLKTSDLSFVDVSAILQLLHCVNMGNVAYVFKIHAASIHTV
jgi:hypothetical protein